jgi:hypothetical protein
LIIIGMRPLRRAEFHANGDRQQKIDDSVTIEKSVDQTALMANDCTEVKKVVKADV